MAAVEKTNTGTDRLVLALAKIEAAEEDLRDARALIREVVAEKREAERA